MRVVIIIMFSIISSTALSQKKKSFDIVIDDIFRKLYLSGTIYFNEDNTTPKDTLYLFMGKDNRFKSIQLISLKYGTIKQIKAFMQKCLSYFSESGGTSIQEDGNKISIQELNGKKYMLLYEEDEGRGYVFFEESDLKSAIDKVDRYISTGYTGKK